MIPLLLAWTASAAEPVASQNPPGNAEALSDQLARIEGRLETIEKNMQVEAPPVEERITYGEPLTIGHDDHTQRAVAFGAPLVVHGHVVGDAVSMGSDVTIASSGIVSGNAVSFGGDVVVEEGAIVRGQQVALGGTELQPAHPGAGAMVGNLRGVFRKLSASLGFAGIGVLLVGLWPARIDRVAIAPQPKPFWYGIAGGILTGGLLVASLLFGVTLIGIPLSMLLLSVLGLGWAFGLAGTCKAVGDRTGMSSRHGDWAGFLTGAAALGAIGLIPWVGPMVVVVLGMPAVGAAFLTRMGSRSS